jgi:LmbE family N-acetylglucosaminyl deacetylase
MSTPQVTILHVSPHADDETLGCGGVLLAHIASGEPVHWLIVTALTPKTGPAFPTYSPNHDLVDVVAGSYGFSGVHRLNFPDAGLDSVPRVQLVDAIGTIVRAVAPDVVYLPHASDVHSDHRIVCDAALPCTKWFRFPSVRRVLAYETLSETNAAFDPSHAPFVPTVYRDITPHLERKIEILGLYGADEIGEHPFPRSATAVRALAALRGSEAGYAAAEAFMLLRDRG